MRTTPVKSKSDESTANPWVQFDVADGSLQVTVRALNGVVPFREAQARAEGRELAARERSEIASRGQRAVRTHTFTVDTSVPAELHVLAVTVDGDLEFVPASKQRPVYYAHLAWYDPTTSEWSRLSFVDG